ncbi:MAG: phosphatidate cytidylyltransferase [Lachnospiraceae bacterium]|nr:phosphatidate cytidylyltransferase [Lachnospiraceae bacterium]
MSDNYNDEKKEKRKTLWVRVRSAAVLTVIAFATIIPGGWFFFPVNLLISAVGMMEFMRIVNIHKSMVAVISYVALGLLYGAVYFERSDLLVPLFMMYLIVLFACMVILYPKYSGQQVLMAFSGLIYVGLGLSYIYQTREQVSHGAFIVWLIFICSWISDSGAYLTGIAIGKHKAFPKLSPKKSVEGCIGGILSSIAFGLIYKLVLDLGFGIHFLDYLGIIVICGAGAVISQVGDLAASAFKRNFNVKDYGHLIPGHGGIMDRFDSIIFVAPCVFYLAKLFLR